MESSPQTARAPLGQVEASGKTRPQTTAPQEEEWGEAGDRRAPAAWPGGAAGAEEAPQAERWPAPTQAQPADPGTRVNAAGLSRRDAPHRVTPASCAPRRRGPPLAWGPEGPLDFLNAAETARTSLSRTVPGPLATASFVLSLSSASWTGQRGHAGGLKLASPENVGASAAASWGAPAPPPRPHALARARVSFLLGRLPGVT